MKISAGHSGFVAGMLALGVVCGSAAQAADYPTKPVVMVTSYPAGGPVDVISRVFAAQLEKTLGARIVVDTRPGRDGIVSAIYMQQAAPDGYTIMLADSAPMTLAPLMNKDVTYDPAKDYTLVTWIMRTTQVLVSSSKAPFKTFPEMVEKAKASPGKYTFASPSIAQQITGELVQKRAGIRLLTIPYKGGAPAVQDVVGGFVDTVMTGMTSYLPFEKTGQLVALAVTGEKRLPDLPDVPTFVELGFPGLVAGTWWGIVTPKGLPPEILTKLTHAVEEAARSEEFGKVAKTLGGQIDIASGAEFAKRLEAERIKMAPLVEGITPPKP